jgi:hypothetical protein
MQLGFTLRGIPGTIGISVEVNADPVKVGSGPESLGFPMLDAVVSYPADGYDAVLGWVQLVCSDDNLSRGREFEIDPLAFLGDLPHPFAWVGLEPRHFDAPSRALPLHLDWLAHTFLCVPDGSIAEGMSAHALVGFSWGFHIRGNEVSLVAPAPLGPGAWDAHLPHLSTRFPAWRFPSGFRTG